MKVEQHFAMGPDSIRGARRFVAYELEGLPQALVDDAVLIVSELATNSVDHAASDFTVGVELDPDRVRLEVSDSGMELPHKRSPHVDEPYGRGLHIVEMLAETWGVDMLPHGGKTIWIVLGVPAANEVVPGASPPTGLVDQAVAFDELIPRWLFAVKRPVGQLAVAVVVPLVIGILLAMASDPQDARLGPLLALVLIAVAGTCRWRATALAGSVVALEYWWYCIPPVRSFALQSVDTAAGIGGMAVLVIALAALTRRIEKTVDEVRILDIGRREQTRIQAELRRRAERTAAQAEAVLALGNVLAAAHTVTAVAEAALNEFSIPASPTAGSIAVVEDMHLRVIASRGAPPEAITALEHVDLARSPWLGEVLAGTPAYVEDRAEFAARYPTALVLRMYASGSWLVVPFRSETTTGLLSLHYIEPQPLKDFRLYFSLVSELLGTSLDRARSEEQQKRQHRQLEQSFAERDRIARTLSTSLLPPAMPRLAGFASAGWLVPASTDQVAGDFYDLFAVSDGGWVAVLGDVCGKGAEAAAVTSLARYAARAAALDNPDPAHVARVANQALVADPSELFCTAVIVRFIPDASQIDVTLAGHLQARLIGDGEVTRLGTYGAALGLATSPPRVDRFPLPCQGKVVLFSDGLVERDPSFGESEFDDFLRQTSALGVQALTAEIRTLLRRLKPVHRDDVAVLVVERTG